MLEDRVVPQYRRVLAHVNSSHFRALHPSILRMQAAHPRHQEEAPIVKMLDLDPRLLIKLHPTQIKKKSEASVLSLKIFLANPQLT